MRAWKKDLDALVEQTMAFVKSVKTETAYTPIVSLTTVAPHVSSAQAILDRALAPQAPAPRPLNLMLSERDEIAQRVAAFKAHQEKLRLERDAFFNNTLASIKQSINAPRV